MAEPDIWYTTAGDHDAPVLLCLHGIGSCADAFEPQFPLAEATGRRLVAWDAPGYRHSPDPSVEPGRAWTLDDWADAAAWLIGQTGAGPADVLGVSWGGVTATRLAIRHPDLVRSLILADSSVGSGTSERGAAIMRERGAGVDEATLDEFAASRSPLLVHEGAPAELVAEVARLMAISVRQPFYTWACHSMADTDHRADLATIEVPTLVMVGSEDRVTPPKLSTQLAEGIPGAKLVKIAGAGHLANQERPEEFNRLVAHFLNTERPCTTPG